MSSPLDQSVALPVPVAAAAVAAAPGAAAARPTDGDDAPAPRPTVLEQFREIGGDFVTHRELLVQLTLRDVRLRYKQAAMGFAWALLMPVFVVLSGFVVRFAMAHYSGTSVGGQDVGGMAVKAVAWAFFAGAIGFSTGSLVANSALVTKVYFAREVLPLSAILAQVFDSAVGATAVSVLLLAVGVRPTAALLWAVPLALLLVVFTAAVGLFLSCANLFYRDVKYIVQLLLTFGIFFTPVLFEPVMFGARGARLLMLNPLSPFLEGLRLSVVRGHNLLLPLAEVSGKGETVLVWSPWYLAYSFAWGVGGLALASLLFHKLEFIFAEHI